MVRLPGMEATVIEKFWNNVEKTDTCWLWKGSVYNGRFPAFKCKKIVYGARHISMIIAGKLIIEGKQVKPMVCNNLLCVNPDHLVSGDESRFWSKVKRDLSTECWIWTGDTDKGGYGVFCITNGGKSIEHRATVYSLFLDGVMVPEGMQVCHTCDNPPCINPSHLWVGTNQENTADKIAKNRQSKGSGNRKPYVLLTPEMVVSVRDRFAKGESMRSIAESLGTVHRTISEAIRRITWKDIP